MALENPNAENSGDPVPTLTVGTEGGTLTIFELHQAIFSLVILLLAAVAAGYITERIKFPALLGNYQNCFGIIFYFRDADNRDRFSKLSSIRSESRVSRFGFYSDPQFCFFDYSSSSWTGIGFEGFDQVEGTF